MKTSINQTSRTRLASLILSAALLGGCTAMMPTRQAPQLFEAPPVTQPTTVERGSSSVTPGSLWAGSDSWTLVGSVKAMRPGDVITVNIVDIGEGESSTAAAVQRKSDLLAGISNLFGFESEFGSGDRASGRQQDVQLDKMLKANSELSYSADGELQRDHKLLAKISAVVVDVLPNGNFKIHGYKVTTIGKEQNFITVQGTVRPTDLDAANTIDSTLIANASIEYGVNGPNTGDVQSPGWGMRIFSMLWPF
jgi:flagellar L-ring protein precursor FlgH